ncbi:hypothetical protein BDA99DRAFT_591345 [Phascolomyces articulosus]|uniref:F-box domain-containing protein n=1 Tax=Phascolomyces articulosus TaxID=60185 RepID=A0AAD5K8Y5_9FUNG|nr:hypothetical protein BDA99DRAFT_591345 [Phascolomyces articulosus]
MADGHFKSIQLLKTIDTRTPIFLKNVILLSNAFYQSRHTLRHLDLDMREKPNVVILAEVLSACCPIINSILSRHTLTALCNCSDLDTVELFGLYRVNKSGTFYLLANATSIKLEIKAQLRMKFLFFEIIGQNENATEMTEFGSHSIILAGSTNVAYYLKRFSYQTNLHSIHDASTTIDYILKSQLLVLLDIRSYSYTLQCQREAANADAQKMIRYLPELAAGYIRQGNIFSMYDQQQQAIDIYNTGLQNVKAYFLDGHPSHLDEIQKLETCKNYATTLSSKRIDFISTLPTECTHYIISFLSMEEKTTCIFVNKVWRQHVFDCIGKLRLEHLFVKGKKEDKMLAKAAPYFAHHTRALIFDTSDAEICGTYLKYMAYGYFTRIWLLKTTDNAAQVLKQNSGLLSSAFYQTRHTMIRLDLHIGESHEDAVTLTDLLLAFPNLKEMNYESDVTLVSHSIGDLSNLDQHDSLTNLFLKAGHIFQGNDINGILQRCPKLYRFIIDGGDTNVLDSVKDNAPNLKIFAFNPGKGINAIRRLSLDFKDEVSGLSVLVAHSVNARVIPTLRLLPLIYKNRDTLTTLHVNVSDLSEEELHQVKTTYPDFKFQGMESLRFPYLPRIQEILFGATYDTTTLKSLAISHIYNMKTFIKSLERLSSFDSLGIMHVRSPIEQSDFYKLLEILARHSEPGLPSLNSIILQNVAGLNDTMLYVLGNIKTLWSVSLSDLKDVTAEGLSNFIQKMGDQLRDVKLFNLNIVTDTTLKALCDCNSLDTVELDDLQRVTKSGVDHLLANTTSVKLKEIRVRNCAKISTQVCVIEKKRSLSLHISLNELKCDSKTAICNCNIHLIKYPFITVKWPRNVQQKSQYQIFISFIEMYLQATSYSRMSQNLTYKQLLISISTVTATIITVSFHPLICKIKKFDHFEKIYQKHGIKTILFINHFPYNTWKYHNTCYFIDMACASGIVPKKKLTKNEKFD